MDLKWKVFILLQAAIEAALKLNLNNKFFSGPYGKTI